MRYILIALPVFLLALLGAMPCLEAQQNALASPGALVKEGKEIRFTILTPQLIRLEWDSTGLFNDNASFIVVNRHLPVPSFTVTRTNGWLVITTAALEIRYRLQSGKFDNGNLAIRYLPDAQQAFTWAPGTLQTNNLKGTARTLDGYDGDTFYNNSKPALQLEDGLLSKDGWTLIDDSKSFLFDNSDWPWVQERPSQQAQDWYFMGYGTNYKSALYEYTLIAGKVPLPPRYAFGYWWSRYWRYSDNELRKLVADFEKFNLPLDVLVIDMDWHITDSLYLSRDEFDQRRNWTGWTWDKGVFPDPAGFLKWAGNHHLKTTLNLHPASGIASFEEQYSDFAKRMNFDATTGKNIPYEGSNKKFMQNLFDGVLHPMEKQGVDFWWLDWQQWPYDKKLKKLDNVWWLNYTFFTDMERNAGTRPMLYHRWGGLGNHRYQIGFSGDAIITWKSLEYQPYFTNAASNVLYGYWSHDIGGHMFGAGGEHELDPELYTRWMQYGALSPIFRTHSAKSALLNKEVWNFRGDYFEALTNAIRLRYTLAPYIYTMARKTYDTGISLCRPMYYDYPRSKEAYEFTRQYQFGDDLLVAPIGAPMVNGLSAVKAWLPAGNDWYEWHTGTLLKGGQVAERHFAIDEYPLYVKAGAIIPMYPAIRNLEENPSATILGIFPGAAGSTKVYEDNGNDKRYAQQYATTTVTTEIPANRLFRINILPRKGSYAGMKPRKDYQLSLYGVEMPVSILVNGKKLSYSDSTAAQGWQYNGTELSVTIRIPAVTCAQPTTITVAYDKNRSAVVTNGLVQQFKRLTKTTTALKFKAARLVIPAAIGKAEETNRALEYQPHRFYELINEFNHNFRDIPNTIKEARLQKDVEEWYLRTLQL
jgi:alpha-glucosidase (family GH31 glycosyl hydrolase)